MDDQSVVVTKTATYFGDLEKMISKFNEKVAIFKDKDYEKAYVVCNSSPEYFFMAYQNIRKISFLLNYNVIINIISKSKELNNNLLKEFHEKTGIVLEDAPEELASLNRHYVSKVSLHYNILRNKCKRMEG